MSMEVKMEARRKLIIDLVKQHGEVSMEQLKEIFSHVSEMTLRRDLEVLDQSKQIVRIHGGARSIGAIVGSSEELYANRSQENADKKKIVAEKALQLIEPNTSIFIDSGATATILTHIMPDDNFLIFTSGITCALELTRLKKSVVYMTGGRINRNSISTNGPQIISQLENINFDIAFLGVTGFTMRTGFTVSVFDDCELKRSVISKAQKVVLLMDSSKVGKVMPFTFATPDSIDILVTDGELDSEIVRQLLEREIQVI